MPKKVKKQPKPSKTRRRLRVMHPNCAGIDVGADEVYVAVAPERLEKNVRKFGTTTPDLREMAAWLRELNIETVAMESTGVYWMPVHAVLERVGIRTHLVDARRLHTAPGRKTDVFDAQWLQELHSYGLLSEVVVVPEENRRLRRLLRLRESHVRTQGQSIQRMQKVMTEMNIRLDRVLSDITGTTGMLILRSIVEGHRDPEDLVKFRHGNCKQSPEQFIKALTGHYTPESLLALKQHLAIYDFLESQLEECEQMIKELLGKLDSQPCSSRLDKDPFAEFTPPADAQDLAAQTPLERRLHELFGIDLTRIPGIGAQTALTLLSEVGTDLHRWSSAKAFASWLGLCPHPRISGGHVISTRTKRSSNRAAQALRMAASGLYRSETFVGAFHKRMRFRKHKAAAVTATAHKLARIIWTCVTKQTEFREQGSEEFEFAQRQRRLRRLENLARDLGVEIPAA